MRVKNKDKICLANGKEFLPGEAQGDALYVAPVYQVLRGSLCAYTALDVIDLPGGGEHRPRIGERVIELDSGEVLPMSEVAFNINWESA